MAFSGFFMLDFLPADRPWAKYGAVYLAHPGIYSTLALWMIWCVNNCATETVRASAASTVFAISSIVAPWVYLPKDAPSYHAGHGILIAMVLGSGASAAMLRLYCQWEKRQRELGRRDHILVGLTPRQEQELGSKHPSFRYIV